MPNPAGRPRIYGDVTLHCEKCKQPFLMRGSEARGYEKKHGRKKPYCSMKCFYEAAHRIPRDLNEAAPLYECQGCHKTVARRRDTVGGARVGGWDMRQKFCSLACSHAHTAQKHATRRASGNYGKGHISQDGYHVVKTGGGKQLRMHRVVMERLLGRPLRANENVHHINGDRADNRLTNLELWVKTQPCGQRAVDKINAALDLLQNYPELVQAAGFRLVQSTGG